MRCASIEAFVLVTLIYDDIFSNSIANVDLAGMLLAIRLMFVYRVRLYALKIILIINQTVLFIEYGQRFRVVG